MEPPGARRLDNKSGTRGSKLSRGMLGGRGPAVGIRRANDERLDINKSNERALADSMAGGAETP